MPNGCYHHSNNHFNFWYNWKGKERLKTDPYLCEWGPILILKSQNFDFSGRLYYWFELKKCKTSCDLPQKWLLPRHNHTWSASWVHMKWIHKAYWCSCLTLSLVQLILSSTITAPSMTWVRKNKQCYEQVFNWLPI